MRRFTLERDEDVSGVSGTGTVAEGVEFTDGSVALVWNTGPHKSTVVWPRGIQSVEAIHGHDGKTRVVFLDPPQ
jgi:predicted heme/steroid binding protein